MASVKKNIVCIFAHPDDESFGPSGTIYKLARKNNVYILCATSGEAGMGQSSNMAKTRERELKRSAKLLGVKKVYFLNFSDGTLSNSLYHALSDKIEKYLLKLKPDIVMTFEPHGISGHIDHIVVSRVSTFVFKRLGFIKEIMYYCITDVLARAAGRNYFIYFGEGYKRSEVDKIVDISDVWEMKKKAMLMHKSQLEDAKRLIKLGQNYPKEECFLIRTSSEVSLEKR